LEDLLDGQAWLAYEFEGDRLELAHGGPARLLVPQSMPVEVGEMGAWHRLLIDDEPGCWETLGYHACRHPWREQGYQGTERVMGWRPVRLVDRLVETPTSTAFVCDAPGWPGRCQRHNGAARTTVAGLAGPFHREYVGTRRNWRPAWRTAAFSPLVAGRPRTRHAKR
jgi:Oxidoreductase molybdopterin binding domain